MWCGVVRVCVCAFVIQLNLAVLRCHFYGVCLVCVRVKVYANLGVGSARGFAAALGIPAPSFSEALHGGLFTAGK